MIVSEVIKVGRDWMIRTYLHMYKTQCLMRYRLNSSRTVSVDTAIWSGVLDCVSLDCKITNIKLLNFVLRAEPSFAIVYLFLLNPTTVVSIRNTI